MISVEEINTEYRAPWGYPCPNESVRVFIRWLAGARYARVLSICSGGEMPFLAFLPRSEEVIAIDHSKKSLAVAQAKLQLIARLGIPAWRALLDKPWEDFSKVWTEACKNYPAAHWIINQYNYRDLQKVWRNVPLPYAHHALARIDRLKLVLGDLTAGEKYAPFDTIYLSNAMEHMSQHGCYLRDKKAAIAAMLKPGGVILYTIATLNNMSTYGRANGFDNATRIAHGTFSSCHWSYEVWRKPA